ncbi:MAG TPA: hypothetical protein VF074_16615 [Pyrinomonadaceae bacterium]
MRQVTFTSMPKNADFDQVFNKLKAILAPYESKLIVVSDTADNYALETDHVMKNKHRLYFGGVRRGKAYVSFHLMPVYACPDIAEEISPELKKHMQGKSCFNFKSPDEKLFNELRRLTKSGFTRFTSKKFYSQF